MTMMLTVSSLSLVNHAINIFSPSRNPCMRRVAPSRYRNDPYNAAVLSLHIPTPTATACVDHCPSPVAPPAPLFPAAEHTHQSFYTASQQVIAAVAAPVPVASTPQTRYAFVRFKHESMTFIAPFRIAVGDTVVVQGDRGENIGVVEGITTEKPSYEVVNNVVRRATDKDKEMLAAQRKKETAAVRTSQTLADGLGLRASIEDAEYQFDLNKLTIFVRRNGKNAFVDFRKLQRGLFREFRCRIWCAYMDEVEEANNGPRFQ